MLAKARQIGLSWLVGLYSAWKVFFSESARILFISQGEEEAWAMVAKSKFVLNNLPDWMKITQIHPDNKALLDFKTHPSQVQALPSTEKAGRSTDATLVVRDELSTHPYGKANFAAIGPTIDSGGQAIDLSTVDKLDANNHFTERINKAILGATREDLPSGLVVFRGGESGATLVFGGWRLRPIRDEGMSLDEWMELRIKPKYSGLELEQEYPETIEDALRESRTRAFFDINATESMLSYVMEPFHDAQEVDTHNGMVKVWKLPMVGEKYSIFTDPSDGVGDPFHLVVLHNRTGEGVAEAHGKVKADICAKIHDELVRFYNKAYNSYEINASAGGKFSESINNLETPNQAPRRDKDGREVKNRTGWYTSPPMRRLIWWGLEEAIRNRLIITHDRDTIYEFQQAILPEGDTPQVKKGLHDDRIVAWGGVWQIRKYATVGEMKATSFKYNG